jgi:hypothetical protein
MSRWSTSAKKGRVRNDREKLVLFVRRVIEMNESPLALHDIRIGFRLHFGPDSSYIETEQPTEGAMKEFLLVFRQFISSKEDVDVRRIHGICQRRLIPDEAKQHLRDARDEWQRMLKQNVHTLTVGGRTRGPDEVVDLWINGQYFHNDPDLRDELDRLNQLQKELLWQQFVRYVGITGHYINYVSYVVEKGLDENWFAF